VAVGAAGYRYSGHHPQNRDAAAGEEALGQRALVGRFNQIERIC
jgi:hypothetical protein